MKTLNLRIHGDNILECEKTLNLIACSLNAKAEYQDSPIHNPTYLIRYKKEDTNFSICLFPGYDRWGINIYDEFQKLGAPLREMTDSIITKPVDDKEEVLFSIEYCNALPAGNNAWQRTGRALTSASIGVPYIYVSDIGGVELDSKRKQKAPRFPNPIIPFSYITLGKNYNSLTLPIYLSSPTISSGTNDKFKIVFGFKELLILISNLIKNQDSKVIVKEIVKKNLEIVKILSNNRKRKDTLRGNEWSDYLKFTSPLERIRWLEEKNLSWKKKSSEKVATTPSFQKLLSFSNKFKTISVGAGDIPICLVPSKYRLEFGNELKKLYGKHLDKTFFEWLAKNKMSLVIVWITGFKPKGNDSRPDRGLVPLARMLLGPEVDILSIVYGPAKKAMWSLLQKDCKKLIDQNGLWEAIISLSDATLIDSTTCEYSPFGKLIIRNKKVFNGKIELPLSKSVTKFSEQDVDSVIHFLFTHHQENNLFESMCNPPGGDWSGLSIEDLIKKTEYKWTSLPRVSKTEGKRPDHVLQYHPKNINFLFSVESKENYTDFEDNVGPRLNRYTKDLLSSAPTAIRVNNKSWGLFKGKTKPNKNMKFISIGAFYYKKPDELDFVIKKGKFDLVLGLEFKTDEKIVIHLKTIDMKNQFVELLKKLVKQFSKRLKIKIH